MSTYLSDDFNRPDSSTVGGGWTESHAGSGSDAAISGNQLEMTGGNAGNSWIYQSQGGVYTGIWIALDITPTSTYGQDYVTVRSTGAHIYGYGVYMYQNGSVLSIVDDNTVKATTSFTYTRGGSVTYRLNIYIDSNNHMDVYLWDKTGPRPATPTLSFTNGGSPYTPTASGTYAQIEGFGQSAGSVDHFYDNYTITDTDPNSGTTYTKTLTETVTNTDNVLKTAARSLAQTLTMVASFVGSVARGLTLSEIVHTTATLQKMSARTFSELAPSSTSGPNSPSSVGDDSSVGTEAWSNPTNAEAADGSFATAWVGSISAYFGPNGTGVADEGAKLVVGGTIVGSLKLSNLIGTPSYGNYPATLTYITYGGPTDLWGQTLSPSDVNASNFGVVIAAGSNKGTGYADSHWLKATNFGFSIPTGATINGVKVEAYVKADTTSSGYAYVDHMRITIYHSSSSGGLSLSDTTAFNIGTGHIYSEAVALADTLAKKAAHILTDAATLTDTIKRTVARSFAEALSTSASTIKHSTYSLAEAATLTDVLVRATARLFTDSISTAVTIAKTTSRSLIEAISNSDTVTYLGSHAATLIETVTATPTSIRSAIRAFIESTTISDTFAGFKAIVSTHTEAVSAADRLMRATAKTLKETVTSSASFVRSVAHVLTETATLTASAIANSGLSHTLIEAVTASDSLIRTTAKTLSEGITVADSLVRSVVHVLAETITPSDALVRSTAHVLHEAISLPDTIAKATSRALTEALTASGVLLRNSARAFTDAFSLTDTRTSGIKYGRILTEALSTADSFTRAIAHVLTERLILTDIIRQLRNGLAGLWQNITRTVDSWVDQSRSSDTWTDQTRSTDAWTDQQRDV